MALKKEALTRIATLLKVKETDLEAAIKDEKEVDVAIDDKLQTFTETEVTTLKTNEYNTGKKAGEEMAVKEAKEKLKLDFQGKTVDGLLDAHGKKVLADAKIEPDKKVQEYEEKVTNLQKTVAEKERELAEKTALAETSSINSELYQFIPAKGENDPDMTPSDIIALAKSNGIEFKRENGKLVPYQNGKQVLDKVSNVREAKDVLGEFITAKKYRSAGEATPGGRGGGDGKPPAKAGTMSELKKQFEAQGKSLLGQEFSEAVAAATKENKDFDMTK